MTLKEKIEKLDKNQLEQFNAWLGMSGDDNIQGMIPARSSKATAPLSFSQERLWFANYSAGKSPVYNLSFSIHFEALSVPVLKRCIYEVVRRHETLRTTFKIKNGTLVQVISPQIHVKLPVRDFSNLALQDKQHKLNSLISSENERVLDLATGPLFKTQLIKLDDEHHVLHCVIHHIISDGWSLNVLSTELRTLYEAYINFKASPLEPIRVQYGDFSEWQRSSEGSEHNDKQLNYWGNQLKNAPQLLPLACANPRPEQPSFDGETQFFFVASSLLNDLNEICRKEESTLFAGLLAVFNILLSKYSDEYDIVVGTPVANRVMTDLEPLIGFFVNTLLIRTKIDEEDSFLDVFKQVAQTTAEAQDNQDVPFELLVENLAEERSLSYNPLFQIMFTLEKTSKAGYNGGLAELTNNIRNEHEGNTSFVLDSVQKGTSKFDMTFLMSESEEGLSGACEYNTSIFKSEVINKFLQHFLNLLETIVEFPEIRIKELALYSERELAVIEQSVSKMKEDNAGVSFEEHFQNYGVSAPPLSSSSRLYVVDKEENILPTNIKGELWLSTGSNGSRQFFPTKLEAVVLGEGNIQILGMVGRLVKIKGRFINLDTLESKLSEQRFLKGVEVTQKKGSVLLSLMSDLNQEEVCRKLVDILQEEYSWLLPEVSVIFDTLKVKSRKASNEKSVPTKILSVKSKEKQEPTTFIEKALAGIWSEITDAKKVSLEDNFFDIGGSSMAAFQLLNRVKNTFKIELDVNKVFLFPTLRSFSKCVEESVALNSEREEPEIESAITDTWEELSGDGYELSFGQEQLWFLYKLNPDSPLYNVPCLISWSHSVQTERVKHVLDRLIERHRSLRTLFSTESGRPEQIVLDQPSYSFREVNIHEVSENREEWGQTAQKIIAEDSQHSFDLEKGPTLRVILFHFGQQDAWLYLNMHHIISDGKSHDILIQEIKYMYERLSRDEILDLPIPTSHYTDFAKHQRKSLQGKKLGNLLDFWKKELDSIPPLLQLPYKGIRPAKQSFNGMIHGIFFTKKEHSELREFSSENGTTVFMTLLTAFNVLLYKYSRQKDIVIGVPVSNRYKSEFERIIGYFVNTTVFRNQFDDSSQLVSLLSQVKEGALRSMSHKELPFELLLGEIQTIRSQSFSPIFQVLFSHQESGGSEEEVPEGQSSNEDQENPFQSGTSKFDLSLSFGESSNRLSGSFEFSTDLFDVELIQAMSRDYKFILKQIMESPGMKLGELHLKGVPENVFPPEQTVEMNGFRLDLEKMQTTILAHEGVTDVHFTVLNAGNHSSLGGYLSLDESVDENEVISMLELPDYMTPSSWLVVETIPRDNKGNCIESKLPPFAQEANLEVEVFELPQTTTEKNLAMIWSDVLKVKEVGIQSSFFSLGGSSLPAIHVALRIKELYGVDVPADQIFDYPTIKSLADYIDSVMSGEVKPQSMFNRVPALKKVQRNGDLPLSFAQERLWFLDQMEPNTAFYNVISSCRFNEPFDQYAMEKTLQTLMERHESLRTVFAFENGRAIQVVREVPSVRLDVEDLRSVLSINEKSNRMLQLTQSEFQEPFDLELGPLFRYKALHLTDNTFLMLFTMHHIISDAWSATILEKEVRECFSAIQEQREIKLPQLPVQYVDFSVWQRRWMNGQTLDNLANFWKDNLAGAPDLLELPFSKKRPQFQTFKGAAVQMELKGEVLHQLQSLSRRKKVTLFATTLAAFQALLHRYTGSTDIIVGTPSANRDTKGIEHIIGFFTNTLVMRTNVEGHMSFSQLIDLVRDNWKKVQKHKDLPFEKMVEMLQPSRSVSYNPIFQIMFSFQKDEKSVNEQDGQLESDMIVELEHGISKFDMTFNVIENERGFSLITEYNTAIFDKGMMKRMLHHYANLLRAVAENEEAEISKIPLISTNELTQLESFEIGEKKEYPGGCLHHFFERAVDKFPDSIAVVHKEKSISYSELEEFSNRVAHQLIASGIKTESRVAICLNPSIELTALTLAVLKAGAVIVPLDKNYPVNRLKYMLEDSNAEVLFVNEDSAPDFSYWNGKVIITDSAWKNNIREYSKIRPSTQVSSDNHLYVLYTSGSTGKPKGAILRHACVSNLLHWQMNRGNNEKYDTLQFSPTSFDVSFQEIFLTWAVGARLIMIDIQSKGDPLATIKVINEFNVERVFMPFVAVDQMANEAASSGILPTSLKQVITAGEQLRISPQVRYLFDELKECTLENQYGPVETHIVTSLILPTDRSSWVELPAIGKALPNVWTYIVDRQFQRVPIGVPGELVIGGKQIATEYLNQKEKTAERFLKNPFGEGKVYLTGDKARFLDDGNIEFIGRLDNQVKIRGFRVEPGEIESVLVKHPKIDQVAVVFHGDSSADRKLVCYFISNDTIEDQTNNLTNHLLDSVPEYMVPTFFIALEELPKTPSGKVNRLYLSEMELPDLTSGSESKAPETALEKRMAALWAHALGITNIGVDDNFFDLGGHSLLATKLIAGIADEFHVRIPVRTIFKSKTLEQLLVSVVIQKAEESGKYSESIDYLDEIIMN